MDQLLDIDKDDDDESSMEKAISLSKRGMRDLVTKTHQKLKVNIVNRFLRCVLISLPFRGRDGEANAVYTTRSI